MASQESELLRSALSELTITLQEVNGVSSDVVKAKAEEAEASRKNAQAENENTQSKKTVSGALGNFATSALRTANAVYGLAKVFASIGEAGRKFAETTGTTASQGAQFQLDLIKTVNRDARRFSADIAVTAEQLRGAGTSFAEVFVGAAEGMRISAEGAANFARSLNSGFKSEFQLTAASMKALVTVGAATTEQFEAFRKASGRAGLSSGQFANLVNKNSLSFMLYGPSFARAAVNAERLGISLASVQKAQESMVTNLDGTIDTVAQINQLGGQIDFGTLISMAETQGPEATLKYLQSTIPPNLFQSASTRALLSGLGIPLEDLMKRQGSVQASAADKIEKAFTDVAAPASSAASGLAGLNKGLKALDEAKVMEIMNGVVSVGKAIWDTVTAFGALIIAIWSNVAGMTAKALGIGGAGAAAAAATAVPGLGAPAIPASPFDYGMVDLPASTPAAPATPAKSPGLFSRARTSLNQGRVGSAVNKFPTQLSGTISKGVEASRAAQVARLPTALSKTVSLGAPVSKLGSAYTAGMGSAAAGVGAGVLAAGLGAYQGYSEKMEAGIKERMESQLAIVQGENLRKPVGMRLSTEEMQAEARKRSAELARPEAIGAGAIQGSSAAIGTVIGGALGGPVGAAIGGVLGNELGAKINEWFPGFGESIGNTFTQMKTAIMPVLDKLKEFWEVLKGPLFFGLKIVGAILGGIIVGAFKILGFVFSKVLAPVLGFVVDILKVAAIGWVNLMNVIIAALNKVNPFGDDIDYIELPDFAAAGASATPAAPAAETSSGGAATATGDAVSRPNYGDRMLITPTGRYALHNNDNVIAYANDLTDGVRTLSYGALAGRMSTGANQNNGELIRKVDELVTILRDAKTTVQVDNRTQQVPRVALTGVYSRNERF